MRKIPSGQFTSPQEVEGIDFDARVAHKPMKVRKNASHWPTERRRDSFIGKKPHNTVFLLKDCDFDIRLQPSDAASEFRMKIGA
jgi:hypothetical protein